MPIYSVGQLVYLYKPTSSYLTANSKKISAQWCGPLVIHEILDRTHYILATLKGDILTDVFSFNRQKPSLFYNIFGGESKEVSLDDYFQYVEENCWV